MRHIYLLFVLVFSLSGCGSKGALYLPDGETGNVRPVSIEEETFKPKTERPEIQNQGTPQEEEEDE